MFLRFVCLALYAHCYFACYSQPGDRGLIGKKDTSSVVGNTYAIIIGISNYKNVQDLQYAHKDAQAFESFLLSGAGGKIAKENIETFLNENATRSNVGDAISVIARKAKPNDRVYFFFAGHGDMEDLTQIENGLLLLYNSPNGNYFGMNDDVIEILDLKRYLSPLSQKGVEMIFIVDACHSGNLTGGVEGVKQTGSALMSSWGKEYKILSCQPDQLSLESAEYGGGRGLFSLQLEEGLKGLADTDGNAKISMFELQHYIQTNVAKYSEFKQIPMVSGDLSKSFFKVDPIVLADLKKQKAQNYPVLAAANTKGLEQKYIDSLDPAGKKIYYSFIKNLEEKRLIYPADTNAMKDFRAFSKKYKDNPLTTSMRRNLASGLNERFNVIVKPLLGNDTSYSTRDECYYVSAELDSCLHLLGNTHYMYPNIKARMLFMNAMALTWAITDKEYTSSMKPAVEKSIKYLEESELLEPNAAYTVSALGVRYFYVYKYDKAFAKFQKFVDLRPNDFSAKYSVALIYKKLKQYNKAEEILRSLLRENNQLLVLNYQLFQVFIDAGKFFEARKISRYITDSVDKVSGNFLTGYYYSTQSKLDSALYFYKITRDLSTSTHMAENNIGHIYFVQNNTDSARHYFNLALALDSSNTFAMFNLATIEAINKNFIEATNAFAKTIDNTPAFTEALVTHLELYFGKHYYIKNSIAYKKFQVQSYKFDLKWLSFVSILYNFIRDTSLKYKQSSYEYIFSELFNFKDQDHYTWYHHACFKALNNEVNQALQSLEKALKLGFKDYFILENDTDLASIRNTLQFKALVKKYSGLPVKPK